MTIPQGKHMVGWREWVSLPDLGIKALKAKVDTGARTSALHAEKIKIFRNRRTGARSVRFLLYARKHKRNEQWAKAPLVGFRNVKSSNGEITKRPVIKTALHLGQEHWSIEITLINRNIMGYRMLLGRSAIKQGFLIDPARSYLLPRPRKPTTRRE